MMKKLVILSGAGISAESGIRTFRDMNGLWEEYDVMEVASIDRLFGAVHRNIKRGVDDRLLITYPYLAGSFDQDQLSQFVEYKYRAESELDLGGVGYINRAINLDGANADWKDWLRQPERISGDLINEGPCPYRPMGEAHPIWKKFLPEHEDG